MTNFRTADDRHDVGFTLVEMMVALAIFAVLAVGGVLLLRGAVDTNQASAQKLDSVADLQRLLSLLESDIGQAAPRTWRDEAGVQQPAFAGTGRGDASLIFIRSGHSNVNDTARSSLQRVQYSISDGTLRRQSSDFPDGGVWSEPAELMTGIRDFRLRFRAKSGIWQDDWQPQRANEIPRALEMTMTMADGRETRNVFLVGTGYL